MRRSRRNPQVTETRHNYRKSFFGLQQQVAAARWRDFPGIADRQAAWPADLAACRKWDVIDQLIAEALAAGNTTPEWHALTRPAWGATEALLRGAALAAQADAPLYIVHMNTAGEVDQLQYAQQQGCAGNG
jgi:dihydroorotase-like cyclic amidohydrolase